VSLTVCGSNIWLQRKFKEKEAVPGQKGRAGMVENYDRQRLLLVCL